MFTIRWEEQIVACSHLPTLLPFAMEWIQCHVVANKKALLALPLKQKNGSIPTPAETTNNAPTSEGRELCSLLSLSPAMGQKPWPRYDDVQYVQRLASRNLR